MTEIGTVLQDRYLIEKQIGAGGMGAVYLAVDQRFNNHVAIKETFYQDDELSNAFEREAHLLNSLHHPILPYVSDYFTENSGYFLVMQYIEGEDLSKILKQKGAFPVEEVLRWTNSLLDALDYLHAHEPPVIHRDIKPQNLKITPRGELFLLDFGLAKQHSEDTSNAVSVFGYSRKYSPLEQIQGTGTDERSDIFALGATVYHLLTGKPPIDVLARASEIVVGNPDPLQLASEINGEIPVGVANVLNSALALNSAGRFVSAKAMRHALEYAVKAGTSPNPKEVQKEISAVAAVEPPATDVVVVSPEQEGFPALEAFAAEVANSSPQNQESDEPILPETPPSVTPELVPPPKVSPPPSATMTAVSEVATRVAPRKKQPQARFAAMIALLICFGLAALYFITKASSSAGAPEQTPTAQTTPQLSSDALPAAAVPTPEILEPVLTEPVEQAKAKPSALERTVEKRELPSAALVTEEDEPAPAEKPKAEPVKEAPVRTAQPAQNSPRREPARQNRLPQVNQSEPVPDIESVFTGQPRRGGGNREQNREERQKMREQMTDEEWREWRRQRREERLRRQNRNPFPF